MSKYLLTAHQVSKILNIKRVTVYAAAADGRLPCIRIWEGRRRALIRFRREDIERLIDVHPITSERSTGIIHTEKKL